jgi:HEPN domain-containing protein
MGGLAFYLAMRFWLTGEFENFDFSDFLENKKWFNIKLLTDANRSDHDHSIAMANDTYAKAIKVVLSKLGLSSNHWLHLGRTIGPKILELLEVEQDIIRLLGNWDPSTQESSYSTKLPMKAVRAANGFVLAEGMHFNARTVVEGPAFERLKMKTPFSWAHDAVVFFEQRFRVEVEKEHHYTA